MKSGLEHGKSQDEPKAGELSEDTAISWVGHSIGVEWSTKSICLSGSLSWTEPDSTNLQLIMTYQEGGFGLVPRPTSKGWLVASNAEAINKVGPMMVLWVCWVTEKVGWEAKARSTSIVGVESVVSI